MRDLKNRKCPPSVKVRLAPLPTRNLNFGNSLNLEECLNRSVAMDRPSSRISDLSNFSANSMISVSRSNYEHQSDDLKRTLNRNVIEALRMKDLRRKRNNYLNENADNYSVDLAFNSKRKRAYDDDEESELDCLFEQQHGLSRSKGTKFARGAGSTTAADSNRLHIPSKNRFVSSQFKNNEIASSYFSINQPSSTITSINSLNQPRNYQHHQNSSNQYNFNHNVNSLSNNNRMMVDRSATSLKRSPSYLDASTIEAKKSIMFKAPPSTLTISNSSSKENANVSNTLSSASISPISRKSSSTVQPIATAETSDSSVLFKSLNNDNNSITSAMETNERSAVENMSTSSLNEINKAVVSAQSTPDKNSDLTKVKEKDKDHSPTYKIPEHFHSIDEHIRDEKKARSRLGNFLRAIYNATTPFISKVQEQQLQQPTTVEVPKTIESNNLLTSSSSVVSTPIKKPDDETIFKLPSKNDLKLNSTSTPLKVSFNLPSSTDTKSTNESIFRFGASSNDQTKDTNPLTALSSSVSTNKSSLANFSFNSSTQNSTMKPAQDLKTPFAINPTTTASTSSSTSNASLFTFGQAATTTTDKQPIESNKQSSFVFKFGGSESNNNNSTINSKPAPVFNFGQPAMSNNSISKPVTTATSSNMSSSLFTFGQTDKPNATLTDSNNKPQPSSSSSAFTFGLDKSNTLTFNPSSTFNSNSTFKAPSSSAFTFGASNNNQTTVTNQLSSAKPNFSFGGSNNNDLNKPKDTLSIMNNSLASNSNNVGFNFNLNPTTINNSATSKPAPAFNFGASSSQQQTANNTAFAFDANQAKPSFNFGSSSSTTQPTSAFNFSAASNLPSVPQFGLNSTNSFNASSNMFTIGRK